MANFPRVTLLALASAAALVLSGCLAPTPEPAPSPVASSSPVFASEEEALAAATEAYAAYLDVSDQITSEGGVGADRIEPFTTSEYASAEIEGFGNFNESGLFSTGESTFDSVRLQQYSDALVEGDTFTVYLCSDISAVRLEDSNGADATPPDRPNRLPLEVDFQIAGQSPLTLVINRSDVWSGTNFC